MHERITTVKERIKPSAPAVRLVALNTRCWLVDCGHHSPHSGVHSRRSLSSFTKNPSLQFLCTLKRQRNYKFFFNYQGWSILHWPSLILHWPSHWPGTLTKADCTLTIEQIWCYIDQGWLVTVLTEIAVGGIAGWEEMVISNPLPSVLSAYWKKHRTMPVVVFVPIRPITKVIILQTWLWGVTVHK